MKKALSVAVAAALALSMVSCGSASTEPAPAPTPAPQQPAVEEPVEEEPEPEPEPEPVVEFVPFESISYTGSGDDVVEITPPDDRPWMLEIKGNAAERHFAVKGYDENMGYTELFVNTTDSYSGFVIDPSLSTVLLEVSAEGDWSITVHDLYANVPSIAEGEQIKGQGDAVYEIVSHGLTARISGNSDEHHFSVKTFGDSSNELLVNTTDVYQGTVMLKGDPFLLIISSESDWVITF